KASQCGATLPAIYKAIVADATIADVTMYYFEVTNTSTTDVQTTNATVNYLQLTSLADYQYDTTYSVRVGVDVNGVWQGWGPACSVSTPSLFSGPVAVVIPQCGTTLAAIQSPIFITGPNFISSYEIRVTNQSTLAEQAITRTAP